MKVSVVVPTRNRVDSLYRTVKSILSSKYNNYEILLIDNSDKVCFNENKKLLSLDKRIKQVKANYRNGIAALRQKGIEISCGEIISFVDDDIEVPTYWLEGIVYAFTNNKKLGIFGCTVENIGFDDIPHGKIKGFGKKNGTNGSLKPADHSRKIVTFGEFNLSLKKKFVDEAGGFDKRFKWGFEGVDLTTRMLRAGCGIKYNPNIIIKHYNIDFKQRKKFNWIEYYRLYFFFKNFETSNFSFLYELKRGYYYFMGKNFSSLYSLLVAHILLPVIILKSKKKMPLN